MTSIRRRTATLVAVSIAGLLLLGGLTLFVVLTSAMTAQFDAALAVRTGALQSLTHYDGSEVEIDFSGEALPGFAGARNGDLAGAEAEYFVAWIADGSEWRLLERSESLRGMAWPPLAVASGGDGPHDIRLPEGGRGRGLVVEFDPTPEEADEHGHDAHEGARGAVGEAGGLPSAPSVRILVALSRAPLDRTLTVIAWCIAGVGLSLAIASVLASRWAVGHGLAPVTELSRRVSALGPETLDARFGNAGLPAELRPIAVQLDSLLARLEGAFEREKRFTAAASHELRTPIAELRMLLEVAESKPRSDREWAETCVTAIGVLDRAQSLCETLLRLSRAGNGPPPSRNTTRVDVGLLLAAEAARASALHARDSRLIRVACDESLAVQIDDATLASIIGNLLDNAFRHGAAAPETPVLVGAEIRDGTLTIRITNSAPALTNADLMSLFEPFWRKDAARQDQSGFGLGLCVARALAHALGGEIAARREACCSLSMVLTIPTIPIDCGDVHSDSAPSD